MPKKQVVIIGSGMGGLLTGVLLAIEGYDVSILEQNKQIGGCLQTFSFDKKIFDSAVHYFGSLGADEVLNSIFSYVGIMKHLRLQRLDETCFDQVLFDDDAKPYRLGQGRASFVHQLLLDFPAEEASINAYFDFLEKTCQAYPLYNLKNGDAKEKEIYENLSLSGVLDELVPNRKLQSVLVGNCILYAGLQDSTPWSTHALVAKSYMDSAWRCVGGASQISKLLWKQLQKSGGKIYKREKVVRLNSDESGKLVSATCASGFELSGDYFISNLHPSKTIALLDEGSLMKKAYRNRILAQPNTISSIMLNIVLEPKKVPYKNYNVNWNSGNPLTTIARVKTEFPVNYSIYFTEDEANKGFAESVSILTYINASEFGEWQETFNNSILESERSAAYQDFKSQKASMLLDKIAERFPELKQFKKSWMIATPLSYRDYLGTVEGSLYGIKKDIKSRSASIIPTKTQIPNLFLTGQNVNLHGILGVCITAIQTTSNFVDLDSLLNKIKQ